MAVGKICFLTSWTEGLDGFWMKATPSPGYVGVSIRAAHILATEFYQSNQHESKRGQALRGLLPGVLPVLADRWPADVFGIFSFLSLVIPWLLSSSNLTVEGVVMLSFCNRDISFFIKLMQG